MAVSSVAALTPDKAQETHKAAYANELFILCLSLFFSLRNKSQVESFTIGAKRAGFVASF
jgi:hypothetical protein